MKEKIKYIVGLALLSPVFASAQLTQTRTLLQSAMNIVTQILIPLVFTLALLFFFWGIAKYIRSEGTGKEEGKKIMIWGVVALFVMSTIWGLVSFIRGELLGNTSAPISQPVPTIGAGAGGGASIPGQDPGSGYISGLPAGF